MGILKPFGVRRGRASIAKIGSDLTAEKTRGKVTVIYVKEKSYWDKNIRTIFLKGKCVLGSVLAKRPNLVGGTRRKILFHHFTEGNRRERKPLESEEEGRKGHFSWIGGWLCCGEGEGEMHPEEN